jgi:hypothetical protein
MLSVFKNFPVSNDEYIKLDKKFGQLCYYASWQLIRKNSANNHQFDLEDVSQELMVAVLRAASYYKRQVYIDSSLTALQSAKLDKTSKFILKELENLWKNRTRHGASRQKFGDYQEQILKDFCKKFLPANLIPPVDRPLIMETKFLTYCKQILWNATKHLGRKISREKPLRAGQVSLSDHDYLSSIE